MARKPLVAGNWKMNGLSASLGELAAMREGFDSALQAAVDLLVCPPATLLSQARDAAKDSAIEIGAQGCHARAAGAHTGDLSAEMLADAGARYVIVGHSERRADHGESDADVQAQAAAAHRAGLVPIVCVGETRMEREAGEALGVVRRQLAGSLPQTDGEIIVAYEPVWAIGTGLTPTPDDVQAMHEAIRVALGDRGTATRILYGGSVKPENARTLLTLPDVDGALVGGASLKAVDFLAIASAYRA